MKDAFIERGIDALPNSARNTNRLGSLVRGRAGALTLSASLALGLGAGCQPAEPVTTPVVEATPKIIDFQRLTLPELGIGLEIQKGIKVDDTSLSPENVKDSIANVLGFVDAPFDQSVSIGKGKRIVRYGVDLQYLFDINHEIIITESSETSSNLAGVQTEASAFTVMTPGLDTRYSYISPVSQSASRFSIPVDSNQYNLSVELCNNFIDVVSVEGAEDALNLTFEEELKDGDLTWKLIGNEVVCNSYALAVASKKAGVKYEDYAAEAGSQALQGYAARGFDVPYIVFPKEVWTTL